MSKEVVAEVIALIELGMIAPEDIAKCLRKANSEPEKALAEQPAQQEPVALKPCWYESKQEKMCRKCGQVHAEAIPPAQRTWVGLTDEELSEVYNQADWDTVNGWEYERAIEAKLRSKNT